MSLLMLLILLILKLICCRPFIGMDEKRLHVKRFQEPSKTRFHLVGFYVLHIWILFHVSINLLDWFIRILFYLLIYLRSCISFLTFFYIWIFLLDLFLCGFYAFRILCTTYHFVRSYFIYLFVRSILLEGFHWKGFYLLGFCYYLLVHSIYWLGFDLLR
jgi:hypothetical protein